MLYLGIDQHSKQLTVNARNERGEAILIPSQQVPCWDWGWRGIFGWVG